MTADDGATTPYEIQEAKTRAKRAGRGSLAGRLVLSDDWDAPEANDAIAQEFGMPAR